MKITAYIVSLALAAFAAPAFAQGYQTGGGLPNTVYGERPAEHGSRWEQIHGYIAYVASPTSMSGIAIRCFGGTDFELSIGEWHANGINILRERNDGSEALRVLQSTMRGGTVYVLDRNGGTLASIRLNLDTLEDSEYGDGGTILRAWLTPSQLVAIRAADRIEVRNGQWTLRFTGNGSTRATNFSNCPMGGNF